MFDLKLTSEDKKWLLEEHPSLIVEESHDCVVVLGNLKFEMVYERDQDKFIVFPPKVYSGGGILLKDQYEIKVVIPKLTTLDLPKVYAVGTRLPEVAKLRSLPMYDLHFNFDGSACLYVSGKEREYFPNDFDFKSFINQLVIPFFYAQTYFQKFGEWPWGEYAHGILGMFEWYNEQENPSTSDVKQMLERLRKSTEWDSIAERFNKGNWFKGHNSCLCGSGVKIRSCHHAALEGMWKFGKNLMHHGLNAKN